MIASDREPYNDVEENAQGNSFPANIPPEAVAFDGLKNYSDVF